MDLDRVDRLDPSLLLRPYGQAERALGRLAHALEATPLHATWLWREITRSAVQISQASGYQVRVDQLRLALIGAPLERCDHTPGLAAATRIFLAAAPLFRNRQQADSDITPWPRFWHGEPYEGRKGDDGGSETSEGAEDSNGSEPLGGVAASAPGERDLLVNLVQELAGFADDGRRPALINLFVDLRKHAATRRLAPGLVRIALPLALLKAGLVPRAAPGLLGGRRLALGMGRALAVDRPLTDWLKTALDDLAKEAVDSHKRLVALGILIEQTSRSRHKVFVAGDLKAAIRGEMDPDAPLACSEPAPAIDADAVGATLDSLFGELDRLN